MKLTGVHGGPWDPILLEQAWLKALLVPSRGKAIYFGDPGYDHEEKLSHFTRPAAAKQSADYN